MPGRMHSPNRRPILVGAAVLIGASLATGAFGQATENVFDNGAGNGSFLDNGNWDGSVPPDDLDGEGISFFVDGDLTITNIDNNFINIDLLNFISSFAGDTVEGGTITFTGAGSFGFIDGGEIATNGASFEFQVDAIVDGGLTFDIGDDDTVVFSGGNTIRQNDGVGESEIVFAGGGMATFNTAWVSGANDSDTFAMTIIQGTTVQLLGGGETYEIAGGFSISGEDSTLEIGDGGGATILDITGGDGTIGTGSTVHVFAGSSIIFDQDFILNGGTLELDGALDGSAVDTSVVRVNSGDVMVNDGGSISAEDMIVGVGGTVTVDGTGAIDINSDFTLRGELTLEDGSVDVGNDLLLFGTFTMNGGTVGVTGNANVNNGGTLDLMAGTFTADSMTVAGAGTVNLAGNLALADALTVNGDFIFDGGALNTGAGGVTVNSSGLFGGEGFLDLGGGDLVLGGILVAGNTETGGGMFEINNGNVDASGGTIRFTIDTETGMAGQLDLGGGDITFDGSSILEIALVGDGYIDSSAGAFTLILNGGTYDGIDDLQLDGFNSVTRQLVGELNGNDYEVTLTSDYVSALQGRYGNYGSFLQGIVGAADADPTGGAAALLGRLDQIGSVQQYQNAVGGLAPTGMAAATLNLADIGSFTAYRDAMADKRGGRLLSQPGPARRPLGNDTRSFDLAAQDDLDAVRAVPRRRVDDNDQFVFARGWYRDVDREAKGNVAGIGADQWGIIVGYGFDVGDGGTLGALLAYDRFDGTLEAGLGTTEVDSLRLAPFGSWTDGKWFVDGMLGFGWNDYEGTRLNPGIGGVYPWSNDGFQVDAAVGGGYRFAMGGGIELIPEGSIQYAYLNDGSYSESSANPGTLTVDPGDLHAFTTRAGLRAQWTGLPAFLVEGSLGWQGDFSNRGTTGTNLLGVGSVDYDDGSVNRQTAYYGAQLVYLPTWNLALSFQYEGRSGDGVRNNTFVGGLTWEF